MYNPVHIYLGLTRLVTVRACREPAIEIILHRYLLDFTRRILFLRKRASSASYFPNLTWSNNQQGSVALWLAFIFFFTTTAAYGLLLIWNNLQINAIHASIQRIQQQESHFNDALIHEKLLLESRLKNVRQLIADHTASSNIFRLIEANTFRDTYFSEFVLERKNGAPVVHLKGNVPSFLRMARQISQFERDSYVTTVSFDGLTRDREKGNILFEVTLTLDTKFLTIPPAKLESRYTRFDPA
ncbi:MAG: hypothetical protein G01um101466_402 [Parcubacteria group bacterium Gr01-1014_66]|nr:MAG: hypothetical protein G01um101466_402 [Parcubacteria group bacterium Gr01-1014_66]